MQHPIFTGIDFSDFFILISKVNHVFMEEKDNPVEKVVINGKNLDGIEIDGILNFESLPRTLFLAKNVGT